MTKPRTRHIGKAELLTVRRMTSLCLQHISNARPWLLVENGVTECLFTLFDRPVPSSILLLMLHSLWKLYLVSLPWKRYVTDLSRPLTASTTTTRYPWLVPFHHLDCFACHVHTHVHIVSCSGGNSKKADFPRIFCIRFNGVKPS